MPMDISNIEGLKWEKRWRANNGGASTWVIPFPITRPANIVFHGKKHFDYGQFGIHIGQVDRLTFLGDSEKQVELTPVDCREGSPTLHNKVVVYFNPSPLKYLIIPPGVAHAFKNLENVFTVNRPCILLDGKRKYFPRNDVIDWPLNNEKYPILKPNKIVVDSDYYLTQATLRKKSETQIERI